MAVKAPHAYNWQQHRFFRRRLVDPSLDWRLFILVEIIEIERIYEISKGA